MSVTSSIGNVWNDVLCQRHHHVIRKQQDGITTITAASRGNNMTKRRNHNFGVGAHVIVNKMAPGGYVGRLGRVQEIVLASRYGIRFDNQQAIVYLDAECVDPAP